MTAKEKPSLATLPKKPTTPPPPVAGSSSAPMADLPNLLPAQAQAPQAPQERPRGLPTLQAAPIVAEEPTQRLSIDVPLSLHVAIKAGCAQRRTKIRDEVLALLEAYYRPQEGQ